MLALAQGTSRKTDGVTVVGPGAEIRGTLASPGRGLLRIEGRVQGEVHSAGPVEVTETGEVTGSIQARDLTVAGVVRGDVNVSGRLELRATARLFGEHIRMRSLVVAEGALFQGQCEIVRTDSDDDAHDVPAAAQPVRHAAASMSVLGDGAEEEAADTADFDFASAARPEDEAESEAWLEDEVEAESEPVVALNGAEKAGASGNGARADRGVSAESLKSTAAATDGRRVLWSRKRP